MGKYNRLEQEAREWVEKNVVEGENEEQLNALEMILDELTMWRNGEIDKIEMTEASQEIANNWIYGEERLAGLTGEREV